MKISSEGYPTIFLLLVILAASFVAYAMTLWPFLALLVLILVLLVLLVVYFFRDPVRSIPSDPNAILSPADGRIILIKDVVEDRYIKGAAKQVSIFLSVFDVHVNRIPIKGTVGLVEHVPGRFVAAFKDEASLHNEQTIIGIENPRCRVLFKQIAGLLARRIVCHLSSGASVVPGDRFGIIKFGSRVDMFLPSTIDLQIKVGDRVYGGSSIIGLHKPNAGGG